MNYTVNYKFNFEGIDAIPFEKYPKDFTFIVDGERYETSRLVADILSPTIRNYHYTDDTINQIYINTNASSKAKSKADFSEILNFVYQHKSQTITGKSRLLYFTRVFLALGNDEEAFKLCPHMNEPITENNVFDKIRDSQRFYARFHMSTQYDDQIITEINQLEYIKDEIDFISKNFEDLDKDEIQSLQPPIIELIITNENLKIKDEDALLQFVVDLYRQNEKNSFLFEHVIFSNVSDETMNEFIQNFNLNDINSTIWKSICRRLVNPKIFARKKSKKIDTKNDEKVVKLEYENGKNFEGIFNYLQRKNEKNIVDSGLIDITTNSNSDPLYRPPKNLIDFKSDNYYDSKFDPGDKIVCFDFKDFLVSISYYSIKTINNIDYSLKNWVIEISNNGYDWTEVDRRTNCKDLNGALVTKTFKVGYCDFARYVRFRHQGPDWEGHNDISINSMEFYGVLVLPDN